MQAIILLVYLPWLLGSNQLASVPFVNFLAITDHV